MLFIHFRLSEVPMVMRFRLLALERMVGKHHVLRWSLIAESYRLSSSLQR
jgi:hypothetical protein